MLYTFPFGRPEKIVNASRANRFIADDSYISFSAGTAFLKKVRERSARAMAGSDIKKGNAKGARSLERETISKVFFSLTGESQLVCDQLHSEWFENARLGEHRVLILYGLK